MKRDPTTVRLAFRSDAVARCGGLVVHPRIGTPGYTVSTESGFTLGGVRFDRFEDAERFMRRVARFKQPWRRMTLAQWQKLRPVLAGRLTEIAVECNWKDPQS